uniref:Uncharacterized protein n=1 Tax=Solanum tuberosum TaxID=4113 RepID=M1BPG3_SOLTU
MHSQSALLIKAQEFQYESNVPTVQSKLKFKSSFTNLIRGSLKMSYYLDMLKILFFGVDKDRSY